MHHEAPRDWLTRLEGLNDHRGRAGLVWLPTLSGVGDSYEELVSRALANGSLADRFEDWCRVLGSDWEPSDQDPFEFLYPNIAFDVASLPSLQRWVFRVLQQESQVGVDPERKKAMERTMRGNLRRFVWNTGQAPHAQAIPR